MNWYSGTRQLPRLPTSAAATIQIRIKKKKQSYRRRKTISARYIGKKEKITMWQKASHWLLRCPTYAPILVLTWLEHSFHYHILRTSLSIWIITQKRNDAIEWQLLFQYLSFQLICRNFSDHDEEIKAPLYHTTVTVWQKMMILLRYWIDP